MPPTLIVDDRAGLVKAFVHLIESAAAEAVAARERFSVAVTGGRDARILLPALAGARVPWARADVFWGDERAVPPSHPDSNFGQAQAWLDDASVPRDRRHRMPADAGDLDAAAREYEATLVSVLGPPATLDLCVLGVGPDGHLCSLFPGHRLLDERTRRVAALDDAPKPPPRRLTLTLPALTAARLVVLTALAAEKRPAVEVALHDPASRLPAALVAREAPRVVVLMQA